MKTVLAVDGGNSKTDVAIVTDDGRLLAAVRGPTSSHQQVGLGPGLERLAGLVAEAVAAARLDRRPDLAVYSLAGADTNADVRTLSSALEARGFATALMVLNDAFGALRAGTDKAWGVVVICGQGVNAAGVAPDGRNARLDALGAISGDWGGGTDVGWAGLAAAVRARDGRGPRTRLERDVPAHFGLASPAAVTSAMYTGRIAEARIGELSPIVFRAAEAGDNEARKVVDRLADEIVTMAGAMIRRLRLTRLDPDVVLAGGVFRARDAVFRARIAEGIAVVAPRARVVGLAAPPVAGAALIGLDRLAASTAAPRVSDAVRSAIGAWDAERQRIVSGPPARKRSSSARSGKPA
ncbi:MAG TPA: BadF/BadG/BcrA/BcrD ATPase family protein [Candidatus Limnocylindrales bacterium]|nr:BadF/BadG/BcrA/BcrD ATPase family protein [Candidatus Limnocylindrales bacterium]